MQVATNDAVTAQHYIVKVNAQNAAVMWRVPIGATVRSLLELTRINGSLWLFDNGTTSYRINTLTGALTPQPLSGLTAPVNAVGYIQGDSNSSLVLFQGGFTAGTGSPLPVAGTGNFAGGWALMGGQTTTTTVQSLAVPPRNLISLRWSDDRGHSWGNPVAQAIGQAGEYLTSLQWQRLAYARDRVFELSWSVPMHTTLQGAWIDVTPAQS
jgi:hypothetical protein